MLMRPDFLLPLAAAQRQFRTDNYQMGSAALLEDLFFDALGTYLRENAPQEKFERRQGREPWDYEFFGEKFSHKENTSLTFTAFWEPGSRDPQTNRYVPRTPTYDFPHPIVLVFSGGATAFRYTCAALANRAGAPRSGRLLPLGPMVVAGRPLPNGRLVLAERQDRGVLVHHLWAPDKWPDLDFLDLWPALGGGDLLAKDLWIDKTFQSKAGLFDQNGEQDPPIPLALIDAAWPSGVYLLEADTLQAAPLEANNKAHSVTTEFVGAAMKSATDAGLFVPMPLWFSIFADTTPPNLYSTQRREYEAIFAARRKVEMT